MSAQASWDDLKFILAVADHGSVASAARALGVNHATVLRRIAGFETRHRVKVFDKTASGYRVSPDRRALIEALRGASQAVGRVERLIEAERPNLSSAIRITSTDAFCHIVLPDIIAELSRELSQPVSILSGNAHLDFARLQADITVRPSVSLPEELAGEQAARFRFGIYEAGGGGADGWLGLEGVLSRTVAGEWLRDHDGGQEAAISSDSFLMLAALAARGRGRAILPLFVGEATPGLECLDVPMDIPPVPIWVASHRDLLQSGRLRRARRQLVQALAAFDEAFTGGAAV